MLSELKYMDMVINETLRKFPAATRTDRVCNEDYEFEGMKIPKGSIWTVVSLYHRESKSRNKFNKKTNHFRAYGRCITILNFILIPKNSYRKDSAKKAKRRENTKLICRLAPDNATALE